MSTWSESSWLAAERCIIDGLGAFMRATEFVESYFDAWNHRDPEAVADHLASDGIYTDIPENVHRTHDELIVTLKDFFSTYQHRYELIGEILRGRDTIAFQYRMTPLPHGRNGGPPVSYEGAEFITLHGGAAITIIDYYDIPGISQPSNVASISSRQVHGPKYAKSGLSDDQLLSYKTRLEQVMGSQQVYLRSDLTLPELAKAVDCSVNHLSQVINSGFSMSFFEYVNQFRIDHAKGLLTELDGQSSAVLNIAFSVGFNSNSAFYAAFKKCVGQTPAQYRRSRLR